MNLVIHVQTVAVTMSELGIHQGDDGFGDFQSLPSSPEGEIASDDVGRNVEPQAEEDVRNSAREFDGGVTPDSPPIRLMISKVVLHGFQEILAAVSLCSFIHLVLAALLFVLCSRSISEELHVNQPMDSKDLHQKISEMRIVETPLHSIQSVAQHGTRVYKVARQDVLLLRTAADKWYKAEKHGPSSGEAGIHFYRLTGPGVPTMRHRSSISEGCSLAHAFFNLSDHELDYSLWIENFLKYMGFQVQSTLNICMEIPSEDENLCTVLKEILKDTLRPKPNEVLDIVQPWNILWAVLPCFTAVFGRFWLGWDRRPFFFDDKVVNSFFLVVMASSLIENPILWTYNLTWLATTYRWHFNFLSFFGYYVGWTVILRGAESCALEFEKHSEDPCLRTAVSAREDLEITAVRANCHRDDSKDDQRKQWPPRTLLFGLVIMVFVMCFEQALGYSLLTVYWRWMFVWCGFLATKGFLSMAGLLEVLRSISPSWTH